MKAILKFLTSRWLWAVIGLLLLALAIWFGGPYLRFGTGRSAISPLGSPIFRLSAIFGIVFFWGLMQFRRVLRANKANQGMVEGLVEAEAAAPDRSAEEVATLKEKFEQAVEVLKKSKGKRKQLNLYDLPWYMIIGPPGSGKTTALVNSGLDFPLAETFGREALSGIGGTRNCDWWFTNEAILIDTAGRYTTQDSDSKVDRSAWEGFLGLLKKYRKRRPINGVMIAISLEDLMTQNEQERIAHARAIKTRIQELDEFFKIRFPVYVILTKTDLVAGFNEFFDDLGRHEREQVWGVTFPFELSESGGAVERFDSEFDALLQQLSSRVLMRMSQERDLRRRAAVYGFPRQLASLKQNLQGFLGDVFRGSRFEQAPLLRGVYLTSGTQEGTPIDRLMGVVARTFGIDQQVYAAQGGQGRSYFIKSLLSDVVFNESEVAGANRRFEAQRAWLQRVSYVGCIALVGLMIVGWVFSYINNSNLVADAGQWTEETQDVVGQMTGNPRNIPPVIRGLNAVESLSARIDERAGGFGSISHGLGLSQAGKLTRRSDTVYRELLENALLPRLIQVLESIMTDERATDDDRYLTLKHYLMLDWPRYYDGDSMIGFFWGLRGLWLTREEDAAAFRRHLEALFSDRPTINPDYIDRELIADMQRVVADIPIDVRVYNRIENDPSAQELAPFIVTERTGRDAEAVFVRKSGRSLDEPIPGLFTVAGYTDYFVPTLTDTTELLVEESWILGDYAEDEIDEDEVLTDVRDDYLDDYIDYYDRLLNDIGLKSMSSVGNAIEMLEILSDEDRSPLVLLLAEVAYETRLSPDDEEEDDRRGNALEGFLSTVGGNRQLLSRNAVDEHFEWLHDFVAGEGRDAGALQGIIDQFYELANVLEDVAVDGRGTVDEGRDAVDDLEREARGSPDFVSDIVDAAASGSLAVAFQSQLSDLNRRWRQHYEVCQESIAGRYPIDRSASDEIPLQNFVQFFGPGGTMDSFFSDNLEEYVDMSQRPWRPKRSANGSIRLSPNAVVEFDRARRIRDTFFAGGQLSVGFVLEPDDMEVSMDGFTLRLEGQTSVYRHDFQDPLQMQWPGPESGSGVELAFEPGGLVARKQGEWAWFRLLDNAEVTPVPNRSERFNVQFRVEDAWVNYFLDANSAYNPFDFDALVEFSCPESL